MVPASSDEENGLEPRGEDDPYDPCKNKDTGMYISTEANFYYSRVKLIFYCYFNCKGHGTHVSGILAGYDAEKVNTSLLPSIYC